MYYTLSQESKDVLAELSETGMGYQLIEQNGHTYLVLNNEYAFLLDDYFLNSRYYILSIDELKNHYGIPATLNLTAAVTLLPNPASPPIIPVGVAILPPFIYTTQAGDIFYRLSSFPTDHCILNTTDLRTKSYATTENDKVEIPSGLAAVARYALPSRLPHIHIWELKPPAGTQVYAGTVIPNFGMSGGGVEAYFPHGFTGGTITSLTDLPLM